MEIPLSQKLMSLGLSKYESLCYLSLLKDSPSNPYQLSKSAGIPTAKVYEVVNRLRERGLVEEVEGEQRGYVPKSFRLALGEWRQRYLETLDDIAADLESLQSQTPASVVWNIAGRDAVVGQGERLIRDSTLSVTVMGGREVYQAWSRELRAAKARGVETRLLATEPVGASPRPETDTDILQIGILPQRRDPSRRTEAATVIADRSIVMFAVLAGEGAPAQGAWTDNPAIVAVAESHVEDRVFMESAMEHGLIIWGDSE